MFKYLFLFLLVIIVISTSMLGLKAYTFLYEPPETPGRTVEIEVAPGDGFDKVNAKLAEEGIIRDRIAFKLLAMYKGQTNKIRAGEFALSTGMLPEKVLEELVSGIGILHQLNIPEGLTLKQTARLVEEKGFGKAEDFIRIANDPSMLKKFSIPAKNAEGFLFPETYSFTKKQSADTKFIVETMLKEFQKNINVIFRGHPPTEKNLFELVTMASIVEKESALPKERPRIAGVIRNRLIKGMLLQVDPTIIYGLEVMQAPYNGNIKRSHLEDPDNPYNTYQHAGLPPGPICSPGKSSLNAAAFPESHELYYFVSKGDGSHHFTSNLSEHNQAVDKYQRKK